MLGLFLGLLGMLTVLVCDDGSRDMTGEIAERLGAEVLRHERNMSCGEPVTAVAVENACGAMQRKV